MARVPASEKPRLGNVARMSRPRRAADHGPEVFGPGVERERAAAVVRTLTRSQRREVFGESDSVTDLVGQRQDAIRAADAGLPPPGMAAERAEASQILQGIDWAMAPLRRIVDVAVKALGWGWLGSGLLAAATAFLLGGAPLAVGDGWEFSGVSGVLFLICVALFPLAGIALVVRNSLAGLLKRRQRGALLRWAVPRPGQLARGLPGWPPDAGDVEPPVVPWLVIGKWIGIVLGGFALPVGAIMTLLGLILRDSEMWGVVGVLYAVGAFGAGLGWALHRLAMRLKRADQLADAGLAWVWEGRLPQDVHSSEADQG